MTTACPEALRKLRTELGDYRAARLSLADLQAAVWRTAETLDSLEERELRDFLQWAEGKLDMIRFTFNSADIFGASLEIVADIERKLRQILDE